MLLTFTPGVCKPDGETPAAYAGTVTLRMPTNAERLELQGEIPFLTDGERKDAKRSSSSLLAVVKAAAKYVKAVDLKRVSDGYAFKSYEACQYESALLALETEIALKLIGDFKVGVVVDGEEVDVGPLGN